MLSHVFLPVLALVFQQALAGNDISEDIRDEIDTWNLYSRCFGEDTPIKFTLMQHKAMKSCMESPATNIIPLSNDPEVVQNARLVAEPATRVSFLPATASLHQSSSSRHFSKRQVDTGLYEQTPEDFEKFFREAQQFKDSLQTKIGNLTCVLTQIGMLRTDGSINLSMYTEGIWQLVGQNGGGKDPLFVNKMRDNFVDCYNIAQAWPQSNLDRSPITKQYGRQMIFFKCAKKAEMKTCAQLQLLEHIEKMYGPIDMSRMPEFKGDKYEAALFGMKVMMEKEEPEERMVRNFLWGNPNKDH